MLFLFPGLDSALHPLVGFVVVGVVVDDTNSMLMLSSFFSRSPHDGLDKVCERERAMYLRRKGGSSNQNILIIFSRAIAGFADGLMYPVKKNIILEMYSVHLYSMFSLFSLNWKVIPVYVAETASKDLRSSMNNVTNISQVPSLKKLPKYRIQEGKDDKYMSAC